MNEDEGEEEERMQLPMLMNGMMNCLIVGGLF